MSVLQGLVNNPHETRQPLIEGVFWSLLAVSSVFLALRLWTRAKYGKWQPDDYVLIFSWLCQVCFVTITQVQVSLGFGKHALDIPFENIDSLAVNGAAGLSVSIVGMAAAKVSFGITLLKLNRNLWRWSNWVIWFTIVTLVLTAIPAAVLPWCLCTPIAKTFVDFLPGKCIDKTRAVQYGMFQAIYSGFADFQFALLPWKVLWGLQMRPVEKFGIGIAMSLGAIAGIMAIMRSLTLDELVQQDVPYEGTFAVMWAEVELATVMIAACIPVMRKMIADEVSTRARGSISRGSPSKDPSSRPRSGQIRAFLRHDRHSVAVPITAPRRTRVSNIHPLMRLSVGGIRSGSMGSLSLSYNGATSRMSVGTFSRWYSVDAHDEHELWRSRATTRHDTEEQQPDQRDLSPSNDEILGEEDRSDRTTMPKHIYFQMQPLR